MADSQAQSTSGGDLEVVRVVLLGKTGAGKSSTGNTLLERDAFRVSRGLRSGTERCQWADAEIEDMGVVLQVTDTPGLSDTHRPEEEVLREVGKSIAVASPGPHVILMVMRCDSRFTPEEFVAYLTLKEMFGPDVKDYMILVFVGADSYGDTLDEQKEGISEVMREASGSLKTVLDDAGWRFYPLNNKACPQDRKTQAQGLISMIKAMKQSHGGKYFKNSVSDQVEELVTPLIDRRTDKGQSREEAVRETNRAIVEDKEEPGFFDNLLDVMSKKVLPVMKKGLKVTKEFYEFYKEARDCIPS